MLRKLLEQKSSNTFNRSEQAFPFWLFFHFFLHLLLLTWLDSLNDRCIINRRFYLSYFILLFFNFNTLFIKNMNNWLSSNRDKSWLFRSLNQMYFMDLNNFWILFSNNHLRNLLTFQMFFFTHLNLFFPSTVGDFFIWHLNQRFHDVSVNINTPLH